MFSNMLDVIQDVFWMVRRVGVNDRHPVCGVCSDNLLNAGAVIIEHSYPLVVEACFEAVCPKRAPAEST
jgi:hypothetical protein